MKGKSVQGIGMEIHHASVSNPSAAKPIESRQVLSQTRRILVTIGIMIGMFLAALDATAVSTAMPTVVSSLGGISIYSWVFSAYILTSTVTLPLWGKLSDIYGRRIFYILGVALFLLGSALSGQSKSMVELIVFRAIQGFGGGALLTLGMIITGEIFSLKERAKIQGLFGGIWGLSSIVGPIIGGFITDRLSWRWVFYLNIPFGLIAAIVMGFTLRERIKNKKVPLDYAGGIVLTTLITIFLLGLMEIGKENGINLLLASGMFVLCLLLLWLFIFIEKRTEDPVLPLDLFSNRFFKVSAITGFLIGMAMFGSISFIPLFVQGVIGTNATGAGSVLTPLLLGWVFFSSISGRLLLRFGYRPLILVGTAVVTLGFFLLSRWSEDTTRSIATRDMIFLGCGMGIILVPLLLGVQNSVPKSRLGIATSGTQFFRSIGGAVGVSVMGTVMGAYMHLGFKSLSNNAGLNISGLSLDILVNPMERQSLSKETLDAIRGVFAHSLHYVFITGLIIALVAFISAFLVPSERAVDRMNQEHRAVKRIKSNL
ncbi:MAG: MFS transporter [Candidatus Dadabacteria bacterium]